jgi:polyhydroxyalkanoate synthesis regulator phasin
MTQKQTSNDKKGTRGVQDRVRRAVERTFQTTVGSAGQTRGRAQELADEVLRRAETGAARASRGVREAGTRQREAAGNVGDRLREAIAELTRIRGDEVEQLRAELAELRSRVDALERKRSTGGGKSPSKQRTQSGGKSASKRAGKDRGGKKG